MTKFSDIYEGVEDFCSYVPNVLLTTSLTRVARAAQIAIDNYVLSIFDESIFSIVDIDVKELLKNIIAYYSALELQKVGNVFISDQGSSNLEGENVKPNFGDKQDALEFFATNGDAYLDKLLSIAKEKEIEIKAKILSVYFSSLDEFEEFKFISNSFRTFLALQPTISQIEKLHVKPRITSLVNIPENLLYAIRGYVANQTILSSISQLKVGDKGFIFSSFTSAINQKWNKEEMIDRKKSLTEDVESFSALMESELNKLFPVTAITFENSPNKAGFFF